jgi:hypothetical protein
MPAEMVLVQKSNCGRPPQPKEAVRQLLVVKKVLKRKQIRPLNQKRRNSFIT